MEERDPPFRHLSPNPNRNPILPITTHQQTTSPNQNNSAVFEAGTYIVQVPQDQVFRSRMHGNGRRIPPNPPQLPDTTDRPLCCACTAAMCLYGVAIIVVLIAGISGAIILLSRDDPILHVAKLAFNPKPGPEFDVQVVVRNPNKYRSISYDKDSGYKVYLLYKKSEIASGEFPMLDRQAPGNTMKFDIAMNGTNKLPDEIRMKKSTSRIPLTLSIRAGLESKVSGLKRIRVWCGLVVNELDKDTKILWQRCRSTK